MIDLEDVPARKAGPGRGSASKWDPYIEAARANPGKAVIAAVCASPEEAQMRSSGLRKVAPEMTVMVREHIIYLAARKEA